CRPAHAARDSQLLGRNFQPALLCSRPDRPAGFPRFRHTPCLPWNLLHCIWIGLLPPAPRRRAAVLGPASHDGCFYVALRPRYPAAWFGGTCGDRRDREYRLVESHRQPLAVWPGPVRIAGPATRSCVSPRARTVARYRLL